MVVNIGDNLVDLFIFRHLVSGGIGDLVIDPAEQNQDFHDGRVGHDPASQLIVGALLLDGMANILYFQHLSLIGAEQPVISVRGILEACGQIFADIQQPVKERVV